MQDRPSVPASIFKPGKVRHRVAPGTLTYEAVFQNHPRGARPDHGAGIGGDPVKGMDFIEGLEMFLADKATEAIVMIGEIGGARRKMPLSSSRTRPRRVARSRWWASSPAAPRRPAAAWAMPARSSRPAKATPSPKLRAWNRLESRYHRLRLGIGRRW